MTVQVSLGQKDSLDFMFAEANRYLKLKDSIVQAKKARITLLTDSLKYYSVQSKKQDEFKLLVRLTKEYEYFVYDSAFQYGCKALKLAHQLKEPSKISESKTNIALVLLLKGLYKETIDTLQTIDVQVLDRDKRIEFYSVAYRSYYDLANSRSGHFAPRYREFGDSYCDKIVVDGNTESFNFVLAQALKNLNNFQNKEALSLYLKLIKEFNLDPHQSAICHSCLGVVYNRLGEAEKAKYHLLRAVIDDIKSATMETSASKVLAELLYKDENLEEANKFIGEAQRDADFYGSHARRLQISYVLPDIEAARLTQVKKEKELVLGVSFVVALLSLIVIVFAMIIYRQLIKLRRARKEIIQTNNHLQNTNDLLREASKIKEEYVGYYFNFSSQLIEKSDGMKKAISRKLTTKQYDSIEMELSKYNAKSEKEQLFENFDRIFLKLFPDFVNRFNQLFEEKDRIILKDSHILNTDLRIFALIRLGINNNEKIASILNFSVNTIYTYKTKIKNRSIVPNEEFEVKIMEIKSV